MVPVASQCTICNWIKNSHALEDCAHESPIRKVPHKRWLRERLIRVHSSYMLKPHGLHGYQRNRHNDVLTGQLVRFQVFVSFIIQYARNLHAAHKKRDTMQLHVSAHTQLICDTCTTWAEYLSRVQSLWCRLLSPLLKEMCTSIHT
jgi:hypothetical protein